MLIYAPRSSQPKMFHIEPEGIPIVLPLGIIRNQEQKWEVVLYENGEEILKVWPRKLLSYRSFTDCLISSFCYNFREVYRFVKNHAASKV